MTTLDPTIAAYYETAPEESRLEQGAFQLEELRTREIIERFLPAPPTTVLDVGGAAGAYAFFLADKGYTVRLIDPVERLVNVARLRNKSAARPLAACDVGDARTIPAPDASASAVLLLGPLYHLVDAAERRRALREAARVLQPGGALFAAAISRCASALDGLARELFEDQRFGAIVERDLRDGVHRNDTDRADYFTTAYFHRPEELRAEVESAGLAVEGVFGLEGPGWILPDLAERWNDPRRRASLLHVARLLELEPTAIGFSAHMLAVARR
jgi:ubiquinone/menaquinone biosynthesis C-methylase UbiE